MCSNIRESSEFSGALVCSTNPAATKLQVIMLMLEHDDLGGSCSGLDLKPNSWGVHQRTVEQARRTSSPRGPTLVNGH
ncbi:hypothetical protein A2U01_0087353, partial [Trifolium medium]|nr:hypothetical protein [Trifolium medium]